MGNETGEFANIVKSLKLMVEAACDLIDIRIVCLDRSSCMNIISTLDMADTIVSFLSSTRASVIAISESLSKEDDVLECLREIDSINEKFANSVSRFRHEIDKRIGAA